MNVFKGNPRGCQIPQRVGRHVDGIGVDTLLGAFVGHDSLQWFWLPASQQSEPPQQRRVL